MATPTKIIAGTTAEWVISIDYPTSEYNLVYYLRGAASIQLVATAVDDTTYKVFVPASTTSTWTPGRYWYYSRAEHKTNQDIVHIVSSGEIEILPDPSKITVPFDGRSAIKKILDNLELAIQNRSSDVDKSITINNKSILKMTHEELLNAYIRYKELYKQEQKSQGLSGRLDNIVLVRFR